MRQQITIGLPFQKKETVSVEKVREGFPLRMDLIEKGMKTMEKVRDEPVEEVQDDED